LLCSEIEQPLVYYNFITTFEYPINFGSTRLSAEGHGMQKGLTGGTEFAIHEKPLLLF
jgi:hypothetical protein